MRQSLIDHLAAALPVSGWSGIGPDETGEADGVSLLMSAEALAARHVDALVEWLRENKGEIGFMGDLPYLLEEQQ